MAATNHTKPTDLDLQNVIDEKSSQLRALLHHTYGNAGESFRSLNDELQDHYLWACAGMADEIVESLEELSNRKVSA